MSTTALPAPPRAALSPVVVGFVVVCASLFASCGARSTSSATITRTPRRETGADLDDPRGRSPSPAHRTSTDERHSEASPSEAPTAGSEAPVLEVHEGRASYYADRFEGRSTASGEPYRARELTAASRDLPFGTMVRVVRVDTGASVVVRVNDRGPFGDRSRILDLSRAAAEELDMVRAGVIEIRAEILSRGEGRRAR